MHNRTPSGLDQARQARLRALAKLTPSERVERLQSLSQQLSQIRSDAAAARERS